MKKKSNHKCRVLLVSRNYSNLLCMARSLAGGDYDIEMVRLVQKKSRLFKLISRWNPEASSRYVSRYYACMCGENPQIFYRFLMSIKDPNRKTLVISCDDLSLPWIDDQLKRLSKYYILSHVNQTQGALNHLMHKEVQKKLVTEYGLDAAASHEILIQKGQYQIPEGITYPCFLKTAVLVNGSKAYLKRYDDPESLEAALAEMAEKFPDIPLLVEDYIDIKKEYAILGLCADQEVLIPDGALAFDKGGHGRRTGIMLSGQVVSDPELLTFMDELKGFLKTLGYTGLFDVDVLSDGKKLYYCELNLRFGGSGYGISQCGVNLPRYYADYMLFGKPFPMEACLSGIGKTFVSEKILLEDKAEGYIGRKEARKTFKDADIHFIYDKQDPNPYRIVSLYFKLASIPKKLKKKLKKH